MARIRAARRVIDPVFLDTPLYRCEALEPGLGCTVSIKLETANPVRSFKARGTEVVASLLAGHGSRAVVCASAGNLAMETVMPRCVGTMQPAPLSSNSLTSRYGGEPL